MLSLNSSCQSSSDACNDLDAPIMITIANHLVIALCSLDQADSWLQSNEQAKCLLHGSQAKEKVDGQLDLFDPPGLSEVYRFCDNIVNLEGYKQGKMPILCCGSHPKDITINAVLAGGFFILNQLLRLDEVIRAFEPLSSHLVEFEDQLTVQNCWSALHHVTHRCGWLNFDSNASDRDEAAGMLDKDEFLHYDSPLNGNLHSLIPDKLLVFHRPDDLPGGVAWTDTGSARSFSAAYYAEIFGDIGVNVVVSVTEDDAAAAADAVSRGYDAGAFAEKGIAVVDFPLGSVPTLAQVDRFLALLRQAPGAVAVHGGGAAGLGAAGALIAAHLIDAHRFRAHEAVAWVRMVHPAALPGLEF